MRIFDNLESLSQAAAAMFGDLANQAIASRGRFSAVLAGGETPRRLYEILAAPPYPELIRWQAVHVFWGDERCVPAGDLRSNVGMARLTMLDCLPISADQIHPIQGDLPPAQAAAQYETELRKYFAGQPPAFDLVLLGLGDNAHTASLFPHTAVLNEEKRWVAEVYVAEQEQYRVTLTAPVINQAAQIVFLVSGAGKAAALKKVLEGPYRPDQFPAQLISRGSPQPIWLVDRAAADEPTA